MNDFQKAVYKIVKTIPKGKVASYSWVGSQLGSPLLARAVGNALHHNPYPNVPCHRVVNRVGRLAINFGKGGSKQQYTLLKTEGVIFKDKTRVDPRCLIR